MSTDPTQPMTPPASSGSGSPEQQEPEHREVPEPAAQPSFQPVRPSFTPAKPASQQAQPGSGQARPGMGQARPGSEQARLGSEQAGVQQGQPPRQEEWQQGEWRQQQGEWQQEPPQHEHGPQPGWPPGGAKPRRRRRGRRWTMAIFALIVVVILLVIADRVALAVAENDMADQFVSNGLPVKPSVTIEGFPFLTQLAERDFHQVDISASNIPAGPVTITSASGTLTGMHFNSSFNGATVDHISIKAFVSFGALAAAGGLNGTGITVAPAGPNLLKITAGVGGVLSDTEEAKVTQTGPQQISIQVVNNGSPISGLLSSFGSFSFSLPKGVPASLRITGVTVNSQGLTVTAAASNANLSESSSS
jgi:LmeA-like phospholipid-binding